VSLLDGRIALGGVVKNKRDETADQFQSVTTNKVTQFGRVRRKVSVRAKLGSGQTNLGHLGENAVARKLDSPSGDFAYAPADGRAAETIKESHWRLCNTVDRLDTDCSLRED